MTITITPKIDETKVKLKNNCGEEKIVQNSEAEILLHEIVGHAVPIILQQQGDAVYLENYVRQELHLLPRVPQEAHPCY